MFNFDINFLDKWEESKHKRGQPGNAGQFGPGGGQSKSKSAESKPKRVESEGKSLGSPSAGSYPKNTYKQHVKPMAALEAVVSGRYGKPDIAAQKIKDVVANYSHPTIAAYGNSLLRWLEQKHGLNHGELGKVKSKEIPPEKKRQFKKALVKLVKSRPPVIVKPVPPVAKPPVQVAPKIEPKIGDLPKSRAAEILEELDARNADDIEYKAAFSTGAKNPLKRGETWRGRLQEWVANEAQTLERIKSPTTPVAPVAPVAPVGKVIDPPRLPSQNQLSEYATMDASEFLTLSGIDNVRDKTSRRLVAVADTRAAIMRLPESHRKKLRGVKVINQEVFAINTKAEIASKNGYAGLYSPADDIAYIADFVTRPNGKQLAINYPGHVTLHELGHALDYQTAKEQGFLPSSGGYLYEAFSHDRDRLVAGAHDPKIEAQRKAAEYWLTNNREMFAETYAMIFAPPGTVYAFGLPINTAREVFAKSAEAVTTWLHRNGMDTYA